MGQAGKKGVSETGRDVIAKPVMQADRYEWAGYGRLHGRRGGGQNVESKYELCKAV